MESADEYRRSILEALRIAGFGGLADEIEMHLAAGKRETVKEKAKKGRSEGTFFASIDPTSQSFQRDKPSRFDIRISDFSDREQRAILLSALLRRFVEPVRLLLPLKTEMERVGLESIIFCSPIDEQETSDIFEYEKLFSRDEVRNLKSLIADDLELLGE